LERVITAQPTNVKALFRRSQAYTNIGEYNLSIADLDAALHVDAGNEDVKNEKNRVLAQASIAKKEKAVFSRLFQEDLYSDKSAAPK